MTPKELATKALERIENAEKELKRLKESNIIKLGDRVEVRDNKSCEWSDKSCGDKYYYVADTSNIGGVELEHKHIIIDSAGYIDKYKYCQPINTKKTKVLERIKNAEKELAEAKKELEKESN